MSSSVLQEFDRIDEAFWDLVIDQDERCEVNWLRVADC